MTSKSKNVYIDKLDYIVNEYNNRYCATIKMKPADVNSNINLKLVSMWKYRNLKIFLQNLVVQIGLRKILQSKMLKILFRGHIL